MQNPNCSTASKLTQSSALCRNLCCSLLALFAGGLFTGQLNAQIYIATGVSQGVVGEYTLSGKPINAGLITGLAFPTGLCADNGYLYVANYNGNTVGKYTLAGTAVNPALLSYSTPCAMASDEQGHLYVISPNAHTLSEYTTSGSLLQTWSKSELFSPNGVAYHDGYLYEWGPFQMEICNTAGSVLTTIPVSTPWNIAFDGQSHMFVPRQGYGAIAEYTTSGTLINDSLITGLVNPVTVGLDAYGDLFVGELNSGNGRIGEYTLTGQAINRSLITGVGELDAMIVVPEPAPVSFLVSVLAVLAFRISGRKASRR